MSLPSLLELHNIAELDTAAGYPGPLVRRIPKAVVDQLENGALVAGNATLCELRFVAGRGPRLAIVLTALEGNDLFVYRGDFLQNHVRLPANGIYRYVLELSQAPFSKLRSEAVAGCAFAPQVWRLVFDGPMLFHGVDLMGCAIRPPRACAPSLRKRHNLTSVVPFVPSVLYVSFGPPCCGAAACTASSWPRPRLGT